MDDARALLNSLMGGDRNDTNKGERKVRTFKESEFCRHYLIGLCPHTLFKNTKVDLGSCEKEHDEHIRETFEADGEYAQYKRKWRRGLIEKLRIVLQGVDRRVMMNQSRLQKEKEGGGIGATDEAKAAMAELKQEVSEKLQQAEKAAEAGNFEESRNIVTASEAAKRKLEDLEQKRFEKYKKENICEICGLIIDAQEAEDMKTGRGWHSNGKQHMGYKVIRETVEKFEADRAQDRKDGIRTPSPSPAKVSKPAASKRRSRSRSKKNQNSRRSRSRDKDRRRDNDRRRRSRSKSRGKRRSPSGRKKRSPRRSPSRKKGDKKDARKRSRSKKGDKKDDKKEEKKNDKKDDKKDEKKEEKKKAKDASPEKDRGKSKTGDDAANAKPPAPSAKAEESPPPPPEEPKASKDVVAPAPEPEPEEDIDVSRPRVAFFMGLKK